MKLIKNGVDYPKGFLVSSTNCGLLKDRDDISLIYSKVPAECACVFTQNQVKAAPIIWDSEITSDFSKKQAIIVNVKSANACTGELGYDNARLTSELVSNGLGLKPNEVLVCSTGVIGLQLNMDKIEKGVEVLVKDIKDDISDGIKSSGAILTTDTKNKVVSTEIEISGKKVRIGAMAKGSGMIRPNMATMLAFTTTDCKIKQSVLQEALNKITLDTFNMISVDGDMSTNDTAIVLANGLADNVEIDSLDSEAGKLFYEALYKIEESLAKQIIGDGEGASKVITTEVYGALNKDDARKLARNVVESNLVKTAIFGGDANWGRIVSALGSADAVFDPERALIKINGIPIFENGQPLESNQEKLDKIFEDNDIVIKAECNLGNSNATAWGCDLSYEYVKINGEYRS